MIVELRSLCGTTSWKLDVNIGLKSSSAVLVSLVHLLYVFLTLFTANCHDHGSAVFGGGLSLRTTVLGSTNLTPLLYWTSDDLRQAVRDVEWFEVWEQKDVSAWGLHACPPIPRVFAWPAMNVLPVAATQKGPPAIVLPTPTPYLRSLIIPGAFVFFLLVLFLLLAPHGTSTAFYPVLTLNFPAMEKSECRGFSS